jgi:ribosomal protein S5
MADSPLFHAQWFDARHGAADMAQEYGYAVLVAARPAGFRIIAAEDVETCIELAGTRPILADFSVYGVQS